jgi:predicted N-formylglutamate amidohydrolase
MPSARSGSAEPAVALEVPPTALLGADEPGPVEIVAATTQLPLVLTCDHASNRIPRSLGGMAVPPAALERHIAWDPGAREVTRIIAERTGATALLCCYSRLVVDCNRRLDDPTLIVEVADGQTVPANQDLSPAQRAARIAEIHQPYHQAIQAELDGRMASEVPSALVSIHSFTPVLQGMRRPWHAGVLWDKDSRIPLPLMATLVAAGFEVGDNEPYSGRAHWDYTIDHHAESASIPHAVIEIRHDLILEADGQQRWGELLADTLVEILAHITFAPEGVTPDGVEPEGTDP